MDENIILRVRKLNTSFKTEDGVIPIVKDVDFDVKRGTILAVVGESGCGKSVTMNSVCRLLGKNAQIEAEAIDYMQQEEDGSVHPVHMKDLTNTSKEMRALRGKEISMIFQDPMSSLNPVYKVGRQVMEALLQHQKMSKQEAMAQVIEMFKKLGIPDPENRVNNYPFEFSGGMKQRVVIAIAMINNPQLLIADEPTTALDVTIQAQIMELMVRLKEEQQKTIILITHNMGLVAETADEVAVMYMGRVVESGTADQIFAYPAHPYTDALMRSVPVLGAMEDGKELATIPGQTPNPKDVTDGCEFANRCDKCMDCCKTGLVGNHEVEPGHFVRCHLFDGKGVRS
ncbi:MAG: ABC transporter ATP-binding protein [Lachnospiraceae bacterium]|nr:ABC transporter ATP-binding protein [Lachnospiraceae bacterium]